MHRLILIIIWICLSSCIHTKYVEVPIESSHVEYKYLNAKDSTLIKDSVYIHDSIYIKEKGDTIFQFSYRDKIKYLYSNNIKTDTISIFIKDTVTTITPVIEEKRVEVNIIYWWQKILMGLGLASVFYAAIMLYLKIR